MRLDPLTAALHRRTGEHGPVMLMYHSVRPGKGTPDWTWAVSRGSLEAQLDFLDAEGYATPTLAELLDRPATGRSVVITFDDGYADNLAACEALARRGMRATWFIVTGSIGRPPAWPADGRPAGRLLDADELRQMRAAGMEIASHGVTHARLPTLDDERLEHELADSKAALESLLGNPVSSFAYPYGEWDARCARAVRQAGYRAACTTRSGWAMRDGDPFALRRLTVTNLDTVASLARKLCFGSHDVGWADVARYAWQRLRA
ncbi:polysaccharide deacetylase family protein [Thauera sp. WH-1]|uniref:polysaccharide deacetylase family protein n=2 Tax=unclassified Thauera TaxID=2609274 RepID=UPI0039FBE700